jgi:hypothetical protein
MYSAGITMRQVYDDYYQHQVKNPQTFRSFVRSMHRWRKAPYADDLTLNAGTYEGFVAHDATVQVSSKGEIIQAWIKQKASDFDVDEFITAIGERVEKFDYTPCNFDRSFDMLEIPLFDMHWGVAFLNHYESTLNSILDLIRSHKWKRIVIPFGQDFFHNDSIVNGQTTKGTLIEKVDMTRAVKEGRTFVYALIDEAIANSDEVKVLYTPGNHDRSISWMFMQVLLERYGSNIVDDSLEYRKVFVYGKNAIMVTHGDSKQATPRNLANIFPISFAEEFANANTREVHAGHLHREGEADIYGVMVRRLSSGNRTDEWSDKEDFIGAHKRFMLFEWSLDTLKSIHYV